MSTDPRDKYGFRSLAIGESKEVRAATLTGASSAFYRYCERRSRFKLRRFKWERVESINGVRITRLPDSDKPIEKWERHSK